ncbi:YoaK family protein [Roseomonas sp. CCTCC AB2023176]|uniref:YoaK family protein n=1 Tax=Roseomonas sp. CCTCC AB2023176 TaxID=3342640 RepID=UPI0035DDA938
MAPPAPVPSERAVLVNAMLAFVAGYVDAAGFVALGGLFVAHVTGNFVLLGAQAAGLLAGGVVGKLLALPVFILGVALTRLAILALDRTGRAPLRPLLAGEAALVATFMVLGLAGGRAADPDAILPVLAGMAGVLAMAIQNAKARLILTTQAPTTLMTGNTTQVIIDLVDMARAHGAEREPARGRLLRMAPAIGAFVAGALLGAILFGAAGYLCLLVPLAGLLFLITTTPGTPGTPAGIAG